MSKIDINDIMFSVNDYDKDGDVSEHGIYLHFGGTRIRVAENIEVFKQVVKRINMTLDEIIVNYPEA